MTAPWGPADEARARELLAGATPRPWKQLVSEWHHDRHWSEGPMVHTRAQATRDAALIAAAPDLLERALAEIERLNAVLASCISGEDYRALSAELAALRGRADQRAQERDAARAELEQARDRLAAYARLAGPELVMEMALEVDREAKLAMAARLNELEGLLGSVRLTIERMPALREVVEAIDSTLEVG